MKKQEIHVIGHNTMTTVGEYLKNAREARNLSVRDVAARTKISPKYIQCIEEDDYGHLPKGPYVKGYICAYARQVCGESDKALQLYASCNQTEPVPAMPTAAEPEAGAAKMLPLNNKWQGVLRTRACGGLSLLRRLFNTLPTFFIRRSHAAGDDVPASLSRGGRRHRLHDLWLPAVDRLARRREAVLKWVLYAVKVGTGGAVLVFAGFGAYHMLIYWKHPTPATADRQLVTATTTPPVSIDISSASPPGGTVQKKTAIRPQPANQTAGAGVVSTQNAHPPSPAPASFLPGLANRAAPSTSAGHPNVVDKPPKLASAADITLIKSRVCTAVADRMPVGGGNAFPWTAPRIYVWSLVGTDDPPALIHHIYYHGKNKVGDVALKIGASHWRTWSFQSLGEKRLRGPWRVDIASDDGRVLRSLHFQIR